MPVEANDNVTSCHFTAHYSDVEMYLYVGVCTYAKTSNNNRFLQLDGVARIVNLQRRRVCLQKQDVWLWLSCTRWYMDDPHKAGWCYQSPPLNPLKETVTIKSARINHPVAKLLHVCLPL